MVGNPTRSKWGAVLTSLVLLVSVLAVSTSVVPAQTDEYPEDCEDAPLLEPSGTIQGIINSPEDEDTFRIEIEERGQYVTVAPMIPAAEGNARITSSRVEGDLTIQRMQIQEDNQGNREATSFENGIYSRGDGIDGSSWEIWAEESNSQVCFKIEEVNAGDSSIPYEWGIQLELTTPQVSNTGSEESSSTTSTTTAANGQSVDELQSQLEQKNQRITELENRVQELEQQLESSDDGQTIRIDVSVSPGNNQNSFREGSTAIVEAQSSNADLSNLEIEHRGETYSVDESGAAAIPLMSVGTQQMVFRYEDVSEAVSITVQAASQPSTDNGVAAGQEQQPAEGGGGGEIIPVESPGFGPIHAALALVAFLVLGSRFYKKR